MNVFLLKRINFVRQEIPSGTRIPFLCQEFPTCDRKFLTWYRNVLHVTRISFLWQDFPSCDGNFLQWQAYPHCDMNFFLWKEYPSYHRNVQIEYYKVVSFLPTISSISFFAWPFKENCDINAQIISQISCEILHISCGEKNTLRP